MSTYAFMPNIVADAILLKIASDARLAAAQCLAKKVPFEGSMGAAERMGYKMYSTEAKLFSPMYLEFLYMALGRNPIHADENGYLIDSGRIVIGDAAAKIIYAATIVLGNTPDSEVALLIEVRADSQREAFVLAERISPRVISVLPKVA